MMKDKFFEEIIFEKEKENTFDNSYDFFKKIREKYKIEFYLADLYKRIINYQVDKYGCSLQYLVDRHSTEDLYRLGRNARKRKYERRNKRKN